MENFEQRWLDTQSMLRERFGKLPDMEAILFLVGLNEIGSPDEKFSKEQKQELIHVGTCTLLCQSGYYEPAGKDADGWPHFHRNEDMLLPQGLVEQEHMLKESAVLYFGM